MAILLIPALVMLAVIPVQDVLVVRDRQTEALIGFVPMEPGQSFTLQWRHSVELFPWRERYEVAPDGRLVLVETRFQGFGAGVPTEGAKSKVVNGFIVMKGIDRKLEQLQLGVNAKARFILMARKKAIPLDSIAGSHGHLMIRMEQWNEIQRWRGRESDWTKDFQP